MATDQIKLLFLVANRLDEKAKRDALLNHPDFKFNGKTWQDNGGNFKQLTYEDPNVVATVDYNDVIFKVHEFKPDVVIAICGPEFDASLGVPIEKNWPAGTPGPEWLVPFKTDTTAASFAFPSSEARQRVRAVTYSPPDQNRYELWANDFYSKFEDVTGMGFTPGPWVEARFDAVYAIAYSYMAAKGIAKPGGADLAEALLKLNPPGQPIVAGDGDIPDAFSALSAGGDIDLEGIYSDLNFDSEGWVHNDTVLSCVECVRNQLDPNCDDPEVVAMNKLTRWVPVAVWDKETTRMTGALDCP
jgi:hypothetical protein